MDRRMKKAYYVFKHQGLGALMEKVQKSRKSPRWDKGDYDLWIKLNEPNEQQLAAQRYVKFERLPLISFVCPAYNTKKRHITELVRSMSEQSYPHWELCVADGSKNAARERVLRELAMKEPRLRVVFLTENGGIGKNTQAAASMARGEYLAFVDHDDTLAPFAAFELAKAINDLRKADFFYSDEDKLDSSGRFEAHFKPDYSPDTLKSYNYITHLMAMSKELYHACGGVRAGFDGSQDHDLALRATAMATQVVHIPKVLYHWRAHKDSVAGDGMGKSYAFSAGRRAVDASLKEGVALDGAFLSSYRAIYPIRQETLVSVVIPNRDKSALLKDCVQGIYSTKKGVEVEVVIVENGSKERDTHELYKQLQREYGVKVVECMGEFNYSFSNNKGAQHADGEVLLFMNNDVRPLEDNWLYAMLEHALRPEIGAVGAKLLFEDGTIQHAGVVVGMGGWADHVAQGAREGQFSHLTEAVRNVSAVTGACLMTQRSKFDRVGGFDERFMLCGSDVDLCLKYLKQGYYNIYTPFARLEHRESATRKSLPVPAGDYRHSLRSYHEMLEKGDPYYSLNYDYSSRMPRCARRIAAPCELNDMWRR